jgi:RNA polymerase sigma-70 factor (ECF subfamily)
VNSEPSSENTNSSATVPPEARHVAFAATRWTLVLRARGESAEAQAALSELCEAYYQPVLRFLQRQGREPDSARELTQEFFTRILSRGGFDGADPQRGRFRSYLLGALKHFLADMRDREHAQKRGRGIAPASLHATDGHETSIESQFADPNSPAPDLNFDREWALTVIGRALETLRKEMAADGKAELFEALKPWLMGDAPSMSQAEAAVRLGMNEGAVKVAVHRLRKRFREAVRTEVAQTLRDPALVEEELRHLIAALS